MPSPWTFDGNRYRNIETGRFVGPKQMLELRDTFMKAKTEEAVQHVQSLMAGDSTVEQWWKNMHDTIKTSYIDNYVMTRGGRGQMTQSDWGKIGAMTKEQYKYLTDWGVEFADGKYTIEQMNQLAARAGMYVNSSNQAFNEGRSVRAGLDLPHQPGDGSTACKTNCACEWVIEEGENGPEATWTMGEAEHCETCIERAAAWNPWKPGVADIVA